MVQLLLPARRSTALCMDVQAGAVREVSVLRRAMNVRGAVSQCRLLAAVRPPPAGRWWSKPAECHLVALWKFRQNDFSTPNPNHANIETGRRPNFALSQVSIERFSSQKVSPVSFLTTQPLPLLCHL